jgi:DNA-binding Lrp family transcriptional regulator
MESLWMANSDTYDALDRAVAHALQVNGRAPFRLLGDVLGVSDQTVARRYARLRRHGVLHVVGISDLDRLRISQWVIRVRTIPGAAKSVGAALAGREDTSWINFCGAGTDIVFAAVGESAETLLGETLARTSAIIGIQADRVIHTFYGGHVSAYTKRGPLSADQIAALTEETPPVGAEPPALDAVDRQLIRALRDDGRATVEGLARLVGLSDSSTRRRVDALLRSGTVRLDVDIDVTMLGVPLRALLWLRAETGALRIAGQKLADHAEVTYAAAVTGPASLFVSIAVPDTAALYEYISARLPEVPGTELVESAIVIRHLKAASVQTGE